MNQPIRKKVVLIGMFLGILAFGGLGLQVAKAFQPPPIQKKVPLPPPRPVCGNGIVERGEQCDPPSGGVCNPSCQKIAPLGFGPMKLTPKAVPSQAPSQYQIRPTDKSTFLYKQSQDNSMKYQPREEQCEVDPSHYISNFTVDGEGNMYMTDHGTFKGGDRIKKVTPQGQVSIYAGRKPSEEDIVLLGNIKPGDQLPDENKNEVLFGRLSGLAVNSTGDLYVSQHDPEAIRKINKDGSVQTIKQSFNKIDRIAINNHIAVDDGGVIFTLGYQNDAEDLSLLFETHLRAHLSEHFFSRTFTQYIPTMTAMVAYTKDFAGGIASTSVIYVLMRPSWGSNLPSFIKKVEITRDYFNLYTDKPDYKTTNYQETDKSIGFIDWDDKYIFGSSIPLLALRPQLQPQSYYNEAPKDELYFANPGEGTIYKFDPSTDEKILVAGKPNVHGYVDGKYIPEPLFGFIKGLGIDKQGTIYVLDKQSDKYVIRVLKPSSGGYEVSTLKGPCPSPTVKGKWN